MKAILISYDRLDIEGDFEAPKRLARAKSLMAYAHQQHPHSDQVAMKVARCAGIWSTTSGKILHIEQRGAELRWTPDGRLWSLVNRFGKPSEGDGVTHEIRQLDPESFEVVSAFEIVVPWGGVEFLEIAPDNHTAIAVWREQSDWGYVGVDLERRTQTELAFRWRKGPGAAPPRFSLDGQQILACHFEGPAWWNEREADDPSEVPSPGGTYRIGFITTHDVSTNQADQSEVLVEVPAGWIPADPYDPRWYQMWGPEFPGEDRIRIWLPDGSPEALSMPLGAYIKIERELGTERA